MNFSDFFYSDLALHELGTRKYITDKGDAHTYIKGYYAEEFNNIRDEKINLLEIGLAHCGSARLWRDWFINGNIDVVEVNPNLIKPIDGVNIFLGDAYEKHTLNLFKDDYYDYIIDDGPHTIESQIYAVEHWMDKVKPGGKLVIEDISSDEYLNKLIASTKHSCRIFDFRGISGRWDDIILEIEKSKND